MVMLYNIRYHSPKENQISIPLTLLKKWPHHSITISHKATSYVIRTMLIALFVACSWLSNYIFHLSCEHTDYLMFIHTNVPHSEQLLQYYWMSLWCCPVSLDVIYKKECQTYDISTNLIVNPLSKAGPSQFHEPGGHSKHTCLEDVTRSFIPKETTFINYCFTQWISQFRGSLESHWIKSTW